MVKRLRSKLSPKEESEFCLGVKRKEVLTMIMEGEKKGFVHSFLVYSLLWILNNPKVTIVTGV